MVEVVGCELKYFSRTGVIVVAALPLLLLEDGLSLLNTLFRVNFIILLPVLPIVLGAATAVPVDAFATEDVLLSDVAVIPVDKTDARRFISLEDIYILYSFLPSTRWLFSHYFLVDVVVLGKLITLSLRYSTMMRHVAPCCAVVSGGNEGNAGQ
jgi:hypothetical protein